MTVLRAPRSPPPSRPSARCEECPPYSDRRSFYLRATDFRADLKKITVPTLVIHGDQDAIVPFEVSGKRTAASIPGAKLAVIKGGPHGLLASHPKEVNAALLSFLAS